MNSEKKEALKKEKVKSKIEKKETKKENEEIKIKKEVNKIENISNTQKEETNKKILKKSKKQKALEAKKATLAVKNKQTKWAPVWVVLKKYGVGKKIHPASITVYKRSWRRTKLHIKPRKIRKSHMG
jgi:hypothetical protein